MNVILVFTYTHLVHSPHQLREECRGELHLLWRYSGEYLVCVQSLAPCSHGDIVFLGFCELEFLGSQETSACLKEETKEYVSTLLLTGQSKRKAYSKAMSPYI